ncbi:MAG: nicotinamidase [Candidatus Methylomirabilales bacterium]
MGNARIDPAQDALIVVDVQNDFCPGGALPVPEGDRVIPTLNTLLCRANCLIVATRDWHPVHHCSFTDQGGPWPVHCVAETWGADFHPALDRSRLQVIVSKATTPKQEAYSGLQGTSLADLLRERGIQRLLVGGVATDYCVKATALDARRAGFEVIVLEDAIRGVEVSPGDCARAVEEMKRAGCTFLRTDQVAS